MTNERVDKVPTARDDRYRLQQFYAMPVAEGGQLGQRVARVVTEDDIESAFDELRQRGYAASTINHYIQTIRSLQQWAVRKGHLLAAASPWMQRLIIAALDTGCRRGELLALEWSDVSLANT